MYQSNNEICVIAQGKNIPFSEYVRIDASEYAALFGCSPSESSKALKQAANRLFDRDIHYTQLTESGSIAEVYTRWIGQLQNDFNYTHVKLMFTPIITETSKYLVLHNIGKILN